MLSISFLLAFFCRLRTRGRFPRRPGAQQHAATHRGVSVLQRQQTPRGLGLTCCLCCFLTWSRWSPRFRDPSLSSSSCEAGVPWVGKKPQFPLSLPVVQGPRRRTMDSSKYKSSKGNKSSSPLLEPSFVRHSFHLATKLSQLDPTDTLNAVNFYSIMACRVVRYGCPSSG